MPKLLSSGLCPGGQAIKGRASPGARAQRPFMHPDLCSREAASGWRKLIVDSSELKDSKAVCSLKQAMENSSEVLGEGQHSTQVPRLEARRS